MAEKLLLMPDLLADKKVTHRFDKFASIIPVLCRLSTRVRIVRRSTWAKPNSGVASPTIVLIVCNDTDPCSGIGIPETASVEAFHVTVYLQGGLGTNQRLPRVTTQWGSTMFSVSDQRVQRVSYLVYDEKIDVVLPVDLHSKTDLSKGCVPVGRQFGLLCVKYSLSPSNVECVVISPNIWIVVKGSLLEKNVDLTLVALEIELETKYS